MDLHELPPRRLLVVGLLAILPLAWYGLEGSLTAGVVSAVNVLLILTCLYVAFSPVEGHEEHGTNGAAS
ncbi:hypothetical protein [Halopiger goleimassiliensis]|uniref:hypothetical protein n=1 Tax=Halopiger goleimassiliensis TaxID=1293048 RepID=UPI0006781CDC|nr:hypothetical protein [Halopiger goleimassiliensis]